MRVYQLSAYWFAALPAIVDSSEGSFVAGTPLPAAAASVVDALASEFPPGSFVYPADYHLDGVKISGESSLGKRPVSRALFDEEKKSMYLIHAF